MKISVFGLGYVGAVSCACFAKLGHCVVGVDISSDKVKLINDGKSPIVEDGLDALITEGVETSRIRATQDVAAAISETDVSIVCVGTPSQLNGNIDLAYIYRVCEEIGRAIAKKDSFHSVVIRSTVVPGTIKRCRELIEEISGKSHGEDFGVASNPEFLREGTAISDFWNPPYTIIGSACLKTEQELKKLYEGIEAPVHCLRPEESEMIKYANNNFHAVKIAFANEIGNICKELGVDGQRVMEIVASDKKMNLSNYYLKPGFAFGGSCLPKDVRGLTYHANSLDLETPLLSSLLPSNRYQVQRGLDLIVNTGKRRIGFLGFAFKAGTDDLRESPVVELIETLLGKGFEISLYDANVLLSRLMGKNKHFLTSHIPHINRMLHESVDEVVESSDVIVIGNRSDEFQSIVAEPPAGKVVIDLVRLDGERTSGNGYVGICW
ncbi:MAG: UDP-glucose/GDP-mannose dehydrogenase family protein [Planctomycetota bacterium]